MSPDDRYGTVLRERMLISMSEPWNGPKPPEPKLSHFQADRRKTRKLKRLWWHLKDDLTEMVVVIMGMAIFICIAALGWAIFICIAALGWAAIAGIESWFR